MKILALETGEAAGRGGASLVALQIEGDDARVAAQSAFENPRQLGGQIIQKIEETLQSAGWNDLQNVDALALGAGPGSWTSLRVAFATFKTLAQSLEKPLIAVPSFDALAGATQRAILNSLPRGRGKKAPILGPHLMLCLSPCRPGELYGKLFHLSDDHFSQVQSESIAQLKDHLDAAFSQALADSIESPLLLVGSAAQEGADFLVERGEEELFRLLEIPPEAVTVEVALSAYFAVESEEIPELGELEPLYLAPSSAERNLGI